MFDLSRRSLGGSKNTFCTKYLDQTKEIIKDPSIPQLLDSFKHNWVNHINIQRLINIRLHIVKFTTENWRKADMIIVSGEWIIVEKNGRSIGRDLWIRMLRKFDGVRAEGLR